MMTILRNIIALILGIGIGMMVNMGLIMASSYFVSPPIGVDVNDLDSIQENMHLYEFKHFIFPFLAHALGTLVGSYIAFNMAKNYKLLFALSIGVFFLIGGISMVILIPTTPLWFIIVDLTLAYLPMSWVASKTFKIN